MSNFNQAKNNLSVNAQIEDYSFRCSVTAFFSYDILHSFWLNLQMDDPIPYFETVTNHNIPNEGRDNYSYKINYGVLKRVDLYWSTSEKTDMFNRKLVCKLLFGFFNMKTEGWNELRDGKTVSGTQRAVERKSPNLLVSKPEIQLYGENFVEQDKPNDLTDILNAYQAYFEHFHVDCFIHELR
jgi:hypothetical protein